MILKVSIQNQVNHVVAIVMLKPSENDYIDKKLSPENKSSCA